MEGVSGTIGEKLKQLMIENGNISQQMLSKKTGVGQSTINNILCNRNGIRPQSDTIIALCKYFNVSSDYLLGLSNVKTTKQNKKSAIETLGYIDENAFEALYNLLNGNPHNGFIWDDGIVESVEYLLKNEEQSFPIINLIYEYLFADFENVYYLKDGMKTKDAYCIPTSCLNMPLIKSTWAENPADPIYSQLGKENFASMFLQSILELIKDWRKEVQAKTNLKEGGK